MADMLKKVPVREQEPKVRATNFDEVCLGYNLEEAMDEAARCLNCKNAKCIQGCPVSIDIPAFIHEVKEGNIEEAYKVIGKSSALPAICGRVRENVSAASKESRYLSESLRDSSLTMRLKMISNQSERRSRTDTRSL